MSRAWTVMRCPRFGPPAAMTIGLLLSALPMAAGQATNRQAPGDSGAKPRPSLAEIYEHDVLDVKFREGTQVRLRGGRLDDLRRDHAVTADLDAIERQIAGGLWRRLHTVPEDKLETLRTVGRAKSGRDLPDLNLYQRLKLPPGLDAFQAKEILERFDAVQGAYLVPKPVPPPLPPDYTVSTTTPYQQYLDPAPTGIDARFAWAANWNGQGIQVCDVEYGFNGDHEDLPSVTIVSAPPINPWAIASQADHGTAVLGEIAGLDQGWGVKGIAFNVDALYFAGQYTQAGFSVARAVLQCAAAVDPGDVVLMETQTAGPNWPGGNTQFGLVPSEWNKPVYDAVVTAVANGIIVVEASGNGSQDLDGPEYSTGNDGHWPFLAENDSGAIIVTGGSSSVPHGPLSFSNFGSRVDLQAWGQDVVTTGIGNLYSSEGGNRFYTQFSGSSSASPIVVGAVAALQSGVKFLEGMPLSPEEMRSVLRSTGTPGTGNLAGIPLPNLRAAMEATSYFPHTDQIYVDVSATGANDGSSWADAYSSDQGVQTALTGATAGTQIFVAEGFYFPTGLDGPRTATFELKNGVALFGGFPSGGGIRDPDTYLTRLSGNISASANDSYHVVTASGTDETAILDGFVILNGNAQDANPNDRGGGVYILNGSPTIRNSRITGNQAVFGGGVLSQGGSPRLIDVVVESNTATTRGGGFHNLLGDAHLTNVTFSNNQALGDHGGGFLSEGAGNPRLMNTRFYGNSALLGGGLSSTGGSEPRVENAIFSGNSSSGLGGAIFNQQGTLWLNNITVSGNSATNSGGGLYSFDPATLTLENSIVWGNSGGQITGVAATVSDSIVQGGYAGATDADPLFRDADGADDSAGTPDDDVRLHGTSPAIDAAGNDCVAADISGNDRRSCDMGAHEYLGRPGTFWTNGEVDKIHIGESYDRTPVGGPIRQSADDFVVPPDQACDITSIRAVLLDPTERIDAVAEIYADAGGVPGGLVQSLAPVGAVCAHDPSLTCSDFFDCATATACTSDSQCPGGFCSSQPPFAGSFCTYTCVAPGRSLGALSGLDLCGGGPSCPGARLWEYEFNMAPAERLQAGTYWVSVYGTVEPDSTGFSFWVSAGEGAIRSNPYQLREVGFGWVDGGILAGDISRDLSLEIDAVCGCGTDTFCADADPCTIDTCSDLVCSNTPGPDADVDGLCDAIDPCPLDADNDLDGDGLCADVDNCPTWSNPDQDPVLFGQTVLAFNKDDFVWSAPVEWQLATGDFVTGADIGTYTEDFFVEGSGTIYSELLVPDTGSGRWYILRPNCPAGSYSTGSAAEQGDRDGGLIP